MSTVITEKVDSREWAADKVTLFYTLVGTSSDVVAKAALLAGTPATYEDRVRGEPSLEAEFVDTVADTGLWNCSIEYTQPEVASSPSAPGSPSTTSFSTGGGIRHITQSLWTVGSYAPPGEDAPDFKGAIGVAGGRVEGVDIHMPVLKFARTHYLEDAQVTQAYIDRLFHLCAKMNDADWEGYAAGEVLFLGASGDQSGQGGWPIAFHFAASLNRTITIADITIPTKKGWDYLWILYKDSDDPVTKTLVQVPVAAYVEKVYEDGDFSDLIP